MNIQRVIEIVKTEKKKIKADNPYAKEKHQSKKLINVMKEKCDDKKGNVKALYRFVIDNLEQEHKRKF